MSNVDIFFEDDEEEYDVEEAIDAGSLDPLEDGDYPWTIVEADIEEARSGAIMLALELRLIGKHPQAGLTQFDNIYMRGESDIGRRIGRARYGTLCKACGFSGRGPDDIEDFIGHSVMAEVEYVASDEYRDKNEFKSYWEIDESDLAETYTGARVEEVDIDDEEEEEEAPKEKPKKKKSAKKSSKKSKGKKKPPF